MGETQYDAIAESYRRSDATIIKNEIVKPSFLRMVGDVGGSNVIDLACGSGFATRLTKEEERQRPLGIDYFVGDASRFDFAALGSFDLVTAVFLLPYARDRAELNTMCRNVAGCLNESGRFINVLPNPDVPVISSARYQLTATLDQFGSCRWLSACLKLTSLPLAN
jgi:toxoflavin synthase